MRFLFDSHDGLGLGHVRRNLCVASALGLGDSWVRAKARDGCSSRPRSGETRAPVSALVRWRLGVTSAAGCASSEGLRTASAQQLSKGIELLTGREDRPLPMRLGRLGASRRRTAGSSGVPSAVGLAPWILAAKATRLRRMWLLADRRPVPVDAEPAPLPVPPRSRPSSTATRSGLSSLGRRVGMRRLLIYSQDGPGGAEMAVGDVAGAWR
jgi:hypothetical protein